MTANWKPNKVAQELTNTLQTVFQPLWHKFSDSVWLDLLHQQSKLLSKTSFKPCNQYHPTRLSYMHTPTSFRWWCILRQWHDNEMKITSTVDNIFILFQICHYLFFSLLFLFVILNLSSFCIRIDVHMMCIN